MTEPSPLRAAQQTFADAIPFRAMPAETCDLASALGRTLHGDLRAPMDSPPYPRAIVEGYLVHAADTRGATESAPVSVEIVGDVHPGDEACPSFAAGQAVQTATGSLVPTGAYAIVRRWEGKREGNRVVIARPFPPGFFIEEQGCDLKKGSVVLGAGTVLHAQALGTVASLGLNSIAVSRVPRVSVFSSGNEVIPHTAPLRPGMILDCNAVMLAAAVAEAGGTAHFGGIMRDDFDAFVAAATKALQTSDMLVVSGGTAVGGRDFISDLIRAVGELVVDGVPMRSGRPLIMGVAKGKPIVCVAGHPPEALRGFQLFGVAAVNRLLGRDAPLPEDPAMPT